MLASVPLFTMGQLPSRPPMLLLCQVDSVPPAAVPRRTAGLVLPVQQFSLLVSISMVFLRLGLPRLGSLVSGSGYDLHEGLRDLL